MGQQQLLLIVLGVIIVGIAVVVGINVFTASSVTSNKDAVSSDLLNLGSLAQQYYRKPVAMGGGGTSFTGWAIPSTLQTTGNGSYAATITNSQSVSIVGTGTEKGTNGSVITVTATITPNSITNSITNP